MASGRLDVELDNEMDGAGKEAQNEQSDKPSWIRDFEPFWFTWPMNMGICAIIMHQLPYRFSGLGVLSTIMFVGVLVTFIIFSVTMILRIILHPRETRRSITGSVETLCFLACWPIAWLVLSALVALIVSEAHWGNHAFTIVAYVIWWIGMAWTLINLMATFIIITKDNNLVDPNAVPSAIMIPAVSVATVATTGALISTYSHAISPRLAVPIIIVSYMVAGIGTFFALVLYTLFTIRIFRTGWLPGPKLPTLILLVGPLGQTSTAIQALGSSASSTGMNFAPYHKGTFLVKQSALSLDAAGVLIAMMLFGFGFFWTIYAVYGISEGLFKRTIGWSPSWYATIFPLGTMCTSLLYFSEEMDSPAFRGLTTALLLFLLVDLFANVGFTVWAVIKGRLRGSFVGS